MTHPDGAAAPARAVAAFDFDGTLAPGDSLLRFVLLAAGPRRVAGAVLRHGIRVALATAARIGSRDAAKAAFVSTAMRGLDAAEVQRRGERFSERLHERLRPQAVERLRWHQAQGHRCVIVSASLQVYLEPLGRRLGVDAVLATRLATDGTGALSGRLEGANCRGPEKVARLEAWLAGSVGELWAYGDSAGDRELLAAAAHGFMIRRGRFPVSAIG